MKSAGLLALCLASCLPARGDAAALTVSIDGIEASRGHLMILVEGSAEGWNGREVEAAKARVAARAGTVQHVFEELAPGDYAVQVLHDEDDDGEFDSFLGIPTEGYGFSRNPRLMRRARFDEAAFELEEPGRIVSIRLR
jgi:uncharacterized protein (DUF2141 family)